MVGHQEEVSREIHPCIWEIVGFVVSFKNETVTIYNSY